MKCDKCDIYIRITYTYITYIYIHICNICDIYIYTYVLQKYDSINQEKALIFSTQLTGVTTPKRFVIIPLYNHL